MSPQQWAVELADALRGLGVVVGVGQVVAASRALEVLAGAPGRLPDTTGRYWAGRTCLVVRPEDLADYDRVFRSRELDDGHASAGDLPATDGTESVRDRLAPDAGMPPIEEADEATRAGKLASADERLRSRRFDEADADELRRIDRMIDQLRIAMPTRRTRRHAVHRRGQLDLERSLDRAMADLGEFVSPVWRDRRRRRRPLVVVIDVSASMTAFARPLLRLAVAARRVPSGSGGGRVEVFAFGTRLTRLTDALSGRDPDAALRAAAERVVDWHGGTRIGASIDSLVRTFGPRGMLRGAIVVVCSDGLERGAPDQLDVAMRRLARHAHRIVWVNPHAGEAEFAPIQRGMAAAATHVDVLAAGADVDQLDELMRTLQRLR